MAVDVGDIDPDLMIDAPLEIEGDPAQYVDLAEKIGRDSAASAEPVRDFFKGMNMPIPRQYGDGFYTNDTEFYTGTGSRRLVFVNEYGIILRFTPEHSQMEFDNPHFLKPLFSRKVGAFTVDIDPGYDCPVTAEEMGKIYRALHKKFGLYVGDGKEHNLCFVPGTSPRFPVVIDLDAGFVRIDPDVKPRYYGVQELTRSVWDVRRWLPFLDKEKRALAKEFNIASEGEPTPQDTIYAPLRDIIERAWPANTDTPDPEGIEAFKRACKAFKEAGKLRTPWADPANNYSNTTVTAQRYAARLANG